MQLSFIWMQETQVQVLMLVQQALHEQSHLFIPKPHSLVGLELSVEPSMTLNSCSCLPSQCNTVWVPQVYTAIMFCSCSSLGQARQALNQPSGPTLPLGGTLHSFCSSRKQFRESGTVLEIQDYLLKQQKSLFSEFAWLCSR